MPDQPAQVQYWAVSVLSSRTMWFGLLTCLSGLLSLPEVAALIPLRFLPATLAAVGFVTMYLRTITERPVAFISHGASTPVAVDKIAPPDPAPLGD